MSIAIATGHAGALYARTHEHAVSAAGDAVRESVRAALSAGSRPSRGGRSAVMLEKIIRALRKGSSVEGVLVRAELFGAVCDFLASLPEHFPLPDVVVEAEHEIGLDWDLAPRRTLSVTINDTAYLGYAALVGHEPLYGRVPFDGSLPETISYLLTRLALSNYSA